MADMTDILSGATPIDDETEDAAPVQPVQQGDDDQGDDNPVAPSSADQPVSPQPGPAPVQQAAPSPQQPAPPPVAQTKSGPWGNLMMSVLSGIAGAGEHARTFGQGLAGGAQGVEAYQQQQEENQNQQQQLAMQRQKLAMDQQQSTDTHANAQAQLAMTQAQIANLNRQYALAPKSLQDVIDQKDMEAGAQLTADGVPTVGEGLSKADAMSTVMAHRNADPNSALQYVMHQDGNGNFNVYQITNPNQLNAQPVDVTIGYDPKGQPITKNYGANTISIAQRMNVEANALTNYVNQQNDLAKFSKEQQIETSQAGPRAYAAASAQVRAQQAAMSAPKDSNGNWNPSSEPVMLVNGNLDPSQLSKRSKSYDQTLSLANQYSLETTGKPFDIAQAQTDYKYANQRSTQDTLNKINALTDPQGAISIVAQAAQKLPQGSVIGLNDLINQVKTQFGSAAASNAHVALTDLADNYSQIMGAGTGTDAGRQLAQSLVQSKYSKDQINGSLNYIAQTLAARKGAIIGNNRYLQKQYGASQPAQQRGGQQFSAFSSDGKYGWNGSQWVAR